MKSLTALTLLLACGFCHADLVDDIRCREIGFSKAAEARDADRFASFIDADARFIGSSIARGPDAVVAVWATFFQPGGPAIKWRPQFVEVLDDGTLALTRGIYRITATDDEGNVSEQWGTFNSIWRPDEDGRWKVVFDAGNASPKAPPEDIQALLATDAGCPAG